jgi:peptidoglycan-N-acetylglucosamine deacetylase
VIWQIIALVTLAAAAASEGLVRLVHAGGIGISRPVVYTPALLLAAVALFAMLERRAPLFGRVFWHGSTGQPLIALTFDDGPTPRDTRLILDVLRAEGVPATFFVIGSRVERWPDIVAREVAEGHEIGNHGFDHRVLPLRGPAFIRDQVRRTSDAIERASGRRPAVFRASHGWRNPWVNREAARAGCATVGWTLGVWDTDRPGADVIRRRVLAGVAPGCVLLLHDGRGMDEDADASQVVEALPGIVRALKAKGFRFVTVSELMRMSSEAS